MGLTRRTHKEDCGASQRDSQVEDSALVVLVVEKQTWFLFYTFYQQADTDLFIKIKVTKEDVSSSVASQVHPAETGPAIFVFHMCHHEAVALTPGLVSVWSSEKGDRKGTYTLLG